MSLGISASLLRRPFNFFARLSVYLNRALSFFGLKLIRNKDPLFYNLSKNQDLHPISIFCREVNQDILLRVPDLRSDISIKNIMRVDYPVIKREDSMQRVLEKLDQSPGVSVPVLEGDRMLGLVTADQVLEYLANETGSPAQN